MLWLKIPGTVLQYIYGLAVNVLEVGSLEEDEELVGFQMSEPFL